MPLIYLKSEGGVSAFELPSTDGTEVTLGTDPSCSLPLPPESGAAPQHARITCRPGGYTIDDISGSSGVFAGDRPVVSEYMADGADYTIGNVSIAVDMQVITAQPQTDAAVVPSPSADQSTPRRQGTLPRQAAAGKKMLSVDELDKLSAKYRRSKIGAGETVRTIYVIGLLLVAFYAGVALHHRQRTGNYLPGIVADPK